MFGAAISWLSAEQIQILVFAGGTSSKQFDRSYKGERKKYEYTIITTKIYIK